MSEEKAPYLGNVNPDQEYQIRDEASPRDFYCQIPNLVDLMDLSPHAYRLYGHLRRVAGESGRCWQSTATLAKSCNMSAGKVSESKQELETVYPPLVRIESKPFERGSYHEIAITDIWELNHKFFAGEQITVKTASGVVFHNMNEWRSQYEKHPSQYETKNNPIKNNPRAEKTSKSLPANSGMDWMVAAGLSSADMAAQNEITNREAEVASLYESAMGYNPLNWQDRDMPELLRFLLTKPADEIRAFAKWSRKEYSTFPPTKARQFPLRVKEFWPLAFADQTNKPYQPEESWL